MRNLIHSSDNHLEENLKGGVEKGVRKGKGEGGRTGGKFRLKQIFFGAQTTTM